MNRVLLVILCCLCASALALAAIRISAPPAPQSTSTAETASVPAPSTEPQSDDPWIDWPVKGPTPEQVLYAQPRLMHKAIAGLTAQDPHKVDLYLLTFAGDGSENVFRNEAEYAARLFAQRFGARGHTLVLENNPATLRRAPLATWSNLETALAALHGIMDPGQDILMLYFTSHGSPDHTLLVSMNPLPLDQIGAEDLPGILAEHHFRWKVVVVNACYSGGFIAPLKNSKSLILTAARADRSSFGCGSESEITYFGDAFLARALNHTDNLVTAFRRARATIAGWEKHEKLTPSHPQMALGKAMSAHLKTWRTQVTPGAPLPFHPARSHGAISTDHQSGSD